MRRKQRRRQRIKSRERVLGGGFTRPYKAFIEVLLAYRAIIKIVI